MVEPNSVYVEFLNVCVVSKPVGLTVCLSASTVAGKKEDENIVLAQHPGIAIQLGHDAVSRRSLIGREQVHGEPSVLENALERFGVCLRETKVRNGVRMAVIVDTYDQRVLTHLGPCLHSKRTDARQAGDKKCHGSTETGGKEGFRSVVGGRPGFTPIPYMDFVLAH
jgi:hypothetical protein